MKTNTEPKEVKVKTVEKTLKLLEIMANHNNPLPLTRLGQISNLSLSTTHRLLQTLCRSGFVEREKFTGHYKLGFKSFLIGNAALQNVDFRTTALPHLNKLAECTNESVYLAMRSNFNVIYSDSVKTNTPIQIGIQTGIPVPACQTSSGKVLLAYLTEAEQQKLLEYYQFNQLVSDVNCLAEELRAIKITGCYFGLTGLGGENVREISVPIFNYLNDCISVISIFRPVYGDCLSDVEKGLLKQIKFTAADISRAMGFVNYNLLS